MSTSRGARYCKADLHVHTPASKDFQGAPSAADIVRAAEDAGLDLLAITDHNSADWIDQVRAAAKKSSVTIVPGVEITTPEGHILGLFDRAVKSDVISDLLIQIGVPRKDHGSEKAISTSHAEDVIRKIHQSGGLAIAAHANEKGNGLLQHNKGQFKIRVVPMPELAALEFTQQQDVEKWTTGTISPDYPKKPCIQSSDAHSIAAIGQRVSYLKMQERTVHGIRQALEDYDVRVRFSWNYAESPHPRIQSLRVDQGFFGGQNFIFHESLNCLVGGQGSGKSTVVELLRYCFNDPSPFPHIRKDHDGKMKLLVGHGATVEVMYLDSDGETKRIRREVQPWHVERDVRDSNGNPTSLLVAPALFSQGELVDTARTPMAQLDLIDRRLDLTAANHDESSLLDALKVNARQLAAVRKTLATLVAEIDHPESGLVATQTRHAFFEKQLSDPVLKDFPKWEAEQASLKSVKDGVADIQTTLLSAIDDVSLSDFSLTFPKDNPNAPLTGALTSLSKDITTQFALTKKDVARRMALITKAIDTAHSKVLPLFTARKAQHQTVLTGLKQADARKASSEFRSLGQRLEAIKKHVSDRATKQLAEKKLAQERRDTILRLRTRRLERSAKRISKAAEYQSQLTDIVELNIVPLGDRSAFIAALRDLSRGANIKETDLDKICRAIEPSALGDLIARGDVVGIATAAAVTQDIANRLVNQCQAKGDEELWELDLVDLPDAPAIGYVVSPGRVKPLSELSTGQKGTVIIALALIEGIGPLVVDHPEEPLDTKTVYTQVVGKLRRGKDRRQFIFTTHNANIAVGADAELNHILGATADKGSIEHTGAVDDPDANRLLLLHLEGGREALDRRVGKYRGSTS